MFEEILPFVPRLKAPRKAFELQSFSERKAGVSLTFNSVKEGEFPPFTLEFNKNGKARELIFGFKIPDKIPPSATGWSLYIGLEEFWPFDKLARADYDGEQWGLDYNRFMRDGINGPAVWAVEDLARAIEEDEEHGIPAADKKELLAAIKAANKLVDMDAAGRFVYEAVPAIVLHEKDA